jgi:glycosyltransferase involved in cell wall biosynthesis
MPVVLHVLPHPGGGAETYVDALSGLEGFRHERIALVPSRSRVRAAPLLPIGWARAASRARRADVVHAHGDTAAMLVAPLLRRRPSLITTHGLHRLRSAEGRLAAAAAARLLRRAIDSASLTICTSKAERRQLVAVLGQQVAPRLVASHNGVPLPAASGSSGRAAARMALGVSDAEVAALFVGELDERKDPMAAIDAASRARARGAPLVLLVAGSGALSDAVAARASEAIRPLGHRADTAALYVAADVFVLPSHREGLSFALLEAMSHGLATIVSAEPGNVEAVGDCGLTVDGNDELERALTRLVESPELRASLGAAARRRIETELSDSRFLEATGQAYEYTLEPAPHDVSAPGRGGASGSA